MRQWPNFETRISARGFTDRSWSRQSKSKPSATGVKPRVKLSYVTDAGAENDDPHEEPLRLGIAVLCTFDDVAVLRSDRIRHRRDDATPVVAGDREHETRRFCMA